MRGVAATLVGEQAEIKRGVWQVTEVSDEQLDAAVAALREGGVVACATETFIGLLADAHNPEAVAKVLLLKGRPDGHPMGLLCPDYKSAALLANPWPRAADEMARAHWPGPLTIVVQARGGLHDALLKDGKVALRVPGDSAALRLARAFGGPLTATSANRTGEPATTSPSQVQKIFGDQVLCVDARSPGVKPSTIVDVTMDPPKVLRAGAIVL